MKNSIENFFLILFVIGVLMLIAGIIIPFHIKEPPKELPKDTLKGVSTEIIDFSRKGYEGVLPDLSKMRG